MERATVESGNTDLEPQATDVLTVAKAVEISVFVPIHNEEESIPHLYKELTEVLVSLGREYEIIAVDDGSTDKSLKVLKEIRETDKHLKIVSFLRNYGLTSAISAGIHFSTGTILVGIDADLEQDPGDIPKLIEKLEDGYDLVSGWRRNKWLDGWRSVVFRRAPSEIANFFIRQLTGVRLRDCSSTLKAYRADLIKQVRLYGEMHRFIPVAASLLGARVTEIPVNFRKRRYGRSHYGMSRIIKVILDLILLKFLQEYSARPIQIFGLFGLFLGTIGFPTLGYLVFIRLILHQPIGDRPMLILSVLLIILSVQFTMMGLLGELVTRTYYESQNKPTYLIREQLF